MRYPGGVFGSGTFLLLDNRNTSSKLAKCFPQCLLPLLWVMTVVLRASALLATCACQCDSGIART